MPVGVQRAVGVKRDEFERRGGRMNLRNVEDVPQLCKVWRDVFAPTQVEGSVILPKGLHKPQRREEGAHGGDDTLQLGAARV